MYQTFTNQLDNDKYEFGYFKFVYLFMLNPEFLITHVT